MGRSLRDPFVPNCGQGSQWWSFPQLGDRWRALWAGVGRRRCCIAQLYSCAGRAELSWPQIAETDEARERTMMQGRSAGRAGAGFGAPRWLPGVLGHGPGRTFVTR